MSFNVCFSARDVASARHKLQQAQAPAAVKALVELAIAGIPPQPHPWNTASNQGTGTYSAGEKAAASFSPPRLCCILVETHGHIDESGATSTISLFRVAPLYD